MAPPQVRFDSCRQSGEILVEQTRARSERGGGWWSRNSFSMSHSAKSPLLQGLWSLSLLNTQGRLSAHNDFERKELRGTDSTHSLLHRP